MYVDYINYYLKIECRSYVWGVSGVVSLLRCLRVNIIIYLQNRRSEVKVQYTINLRKKQVDLLFDK